MGDDGQGVPVYAAGRPSQPDHARLRQPRHVTAELMRDGHQLPQLLAHLTGPLTDVTVQAFIRRSRSCFAPGRIRANQAPVYLRYQPGSSHSPCEGDTL